MNVSSLGQTSDSGPQEASQHSHETMTERPRMKNCLYRKLTFTNPKECLRRKRVKNCQGLYEKEAFQVPFSTVRKQLLTSTRTSSQKQTMYIHLELSTMKEAVKVLSKILPRHSNLRGLYLFFHEDITTEFWSDIGHLVSKFSKLKSLMFDFRQKKPEMNDRLLARKFRFISMLAGLTSLKLALTQNQVNLAHSGFLKAAFILNNGHRTEGIVAKLVSRLKKLRATEYNLVGIDSPTDAGVAVYAKELSKLPKLEDVSIRLPDCRRVSDQGLNTYLDYIQTNPNIKKLRMALKINEESTDVSKLPIMHPIWTEKKLQYTSLEIKFTQQFPVEAIDAVRSALEKMTNLGQLVLDFHSSSWDLIDKIESLILICPKLPSLTDLTIRLINCPFIDEAAGNNVIYALHACPHLKKARVEFVSCFKNIRGSATEMKTPQITCTNLRELTLNFVDCTQLKESQVGKIVDFLLECPNLEALNLQVYWCRSFLDVHYQRFAKAVQSMQKLQRVTFGFEGSDGFVAGTACPIGRMVERLPLIRYLDLNFSYFPELVDERMNVVSGWANKLKNLEGLKISMKGCKHITDQGIKMLCYGLEGLNKLGTIDLTWNSASIRELSKALVSKVASTLPNLYCLELHGVKKNGQTSKVCVRLVP